KGAYRHCLEYAAGACAGKAANKWRVNISGNARQRSRLSREGDREARRRDHSLKDLEGKTVAVGSSDSTQARILPLYFLAQEGIDISRVNVVTFDTDPGKHGETGTSEIDVLRALHEGQADAGTLGDLVWVNEQSAGHVDSAR